MMSDLHDGLTHLVKSEKAGVAVCKKKRDKWMSATQEPKFATCAKCTKTSEPPKAEPDTRLVEP